MWWDAIENKVSHIKDTACNLVCDMRKQKALRIHSMSASLLIATFYIQHLVTISADDRVAVQVPCGDLHGHHEGQVRPRDAQDPARQGEMLI